MLSCSVQSPDSLQHRNYSFAQGWGSCHCHSNSATVCYSLVEAGRVCSLQQLEQAGLEAFRLFDNDNFRCLICRSLPDEREGNGEAMVS